MSLKELWIKNNLPQGDLQLLSESNPSGVLRLTQSNYGIDQTTYFRNIVFSNLSWHNIDNKEMASAYFSIVVDGISSGIFKLSISHKPSWECDQNNYTTGLHWGDATYIIQKPHLIGKTLTLYKAIDEDYDYLIDIR